LFNDPQRQILDIRVYIPAIVVAGICLLLVRIGILSFFFLVPLGFAAYRYEYKIAWAAASLAIIGNAIMLMGSAASPGFPFTVVIWNLIHFTVMVFIFAWITVPPPAVAEKVPLSIRFITGYCVGAMVLIVFFLRLIASPGFSEQLAILLNAMIPQSARSDLMTPEVILLAISNIFLRGGSLIACVFLFTFSRQISLLFARIIPGNTRNSSEMMGAYFRRVNSLETFHVNPKLIWIFSSSLLLVVLTRITGLEIPEILLWNILTLCAILYMAQGLGIFQSFLSRPTISPFLKLFLLVLLLVLFFSPLLNVILLGALVLLGTAENWVSFRTPKQNDLPSTPEDET
jgi:hypothetical protein